MIEVYSWPTPNGHKVHIMLEECGLPYAVHAVDIGAGEQFVHGGELTGEADRALDRDRVGAQVVAGDGRGARVGTLERGQDPYQRGLARAVGAQQREDRARFDGEVDPIEHSLLPVALGQAGDRNCVCHTPNRIRRTQL